MPRKALSDLKRDPQNRRLRSTAGRDLLDRALSEVGAARSIVIDEDDHILAGNGVAEAAARAGITKVRIVDTDGTTIVAVRRRGLSEETKRRLAMYDNRTAELSTWDPAQLTADAAAGLDLKPFFTDRELADVLQKAEPAAMRQLQIARPKEVVWVLTAIPLDAWPDHQRSVEAMQQAGVFTTVAIRPQASNGKQDQDR